MACKGGKIRGGRGFGLVLGAGFGRMKDMRMYALSRRWSGALGGFLLSAAVWMAAGQATRGGEAQPLWLGDEGERLLILAPHPDDECIAAAGLIQEAKEFDVPVKVCYLTMGDNNELAFMFTRKHPVVMPGAVRKMGEVRWKEAQAAAQQLKLDPEKDLVFLGYPDFGTLQIWNQHWREVAPFRSMLTRVTSVPYDMARTPGAAYAGEDVLEDLTEVIREFRPTLVVLPNPADHNVDHRALYLFARVALWTVAAEGIQPQRLAYPVHFPKWPKPRHLHPELEGAPPPFLERADDIDWKVFSLAPFQVTNKLFAIRRHHSQYLYSSGYLNSFVRRSEWFGDFADIAMPGATGREELEEGGDDTFEGDDELLASLEADDAAWSQIKGQQDAEEAEMVEDDTDFLQRRMECDGQRMTMVCSFSRPLSTRTRLTFRFYGWRPDRPFGEMPKVEIVATSRRVLSVKDLNQSLPTAAVKFASDLRSNEVGVVVPLELIGHPEKMLISASIARGEMPMDWVAWRAVDFLASAPAPASARSRESAAMSGRTIAPVPAASSSAGAGASALRLTPKVRTAPASSASTSAAAAASKPAKAKAKDKPSNDKPEPAAKKSKARRARTSGGGEADEIPVW